MTKTFHQFELTEEEKRQLQKEADYSLAITFLAPPAIVAGVLFLINLIR